MIKLILVAVFLFIIASLGSALHHLVKHKAENGPSPEIVKALTLRIGLSVLLFIIVFILVGTGILKPQGIGARIHAQSIPSAQNNQP